MADEKKAEIVPDTYVGVDLGVLNSTVACSTREEPTAVAVSTNDLSNRATPSTVGFDGHLRDIGEAADGKITQHPKETITYIPALQGSPESLAANRERFGSQWPVTDAGQVGPLRYGGKDAVELRPASCLAALSKKLISFAAGTGDGAADKCQIAFSVPDSWTDVELGNLRAAVDILGLRPESVSCTPHSYALAAAYCHKYGYKLPDGEEKRVVAFVDFGFSQTTVSMFAFTYPSEVAEGTERSLQTEALACASSSTLGVQSLCAELAKHANSKHKEPAAPASKKGVRLMTALQKSLKDLSMLPDTQLVLECFGSDESDLKVDFSRSLMAELAKAQFEALDGLIKKSLEDAGLKSDDVHSVELVGGGIRIPKVQHMISEMFPSPEGTDAPEETKGEVKSGPPLSKRIRFGLDGSSAVATGAALCAAGKPALVSKWNLAEQKSSLSSEELKECVEFETWMSGTHNTEVMRLEKGNELEGFIYEVRGLLDGPDKALLKPEQTQKMLDDESMWYEDAQYDEGTTFEAYDERLKGLKRKLEETCPEYYEKKRKDAEAKEKYLEEEAEKERQRRKELGMDVDKDDRKMSKTERLKLAMKNKDEGNTVFKAGNLEDAIGRYQRAMQHLNKFFMLDKSPEETKEAEAISLSVHLNMTQVYLKMAGEVEKQAGDEKAKKEKAEQVYKKAKSSAEEALKIDGDSVKAKFRLATALEKLGDIDEASKTIKGALKVEPENADLLKYKERLDKLKAHQEAKAKKMYGKMFGS
eukprot:gnl/MRDRNA2_/MRDRNA2_91200_c0_seq1.p1 gnl/MRDRNA2_/MRDRNA2_91200_c0~~gnl/MRDRNA2_/MRDRNA2_91200_c0_seq1.p1  ORF type:complete len:794 (-),score=206.69 gnl/MRDRNA2_/MRDRNA2_91200_c0_seq1:22-2301(-)